ncbi:MerR family transcriptional regulator [Quadrisphaera sp. INWT6]|uniref:MerR family transcriptional regulator n=1 Tax=Quadrisphaera sp. INWT6 TaxID=2596917 RepID=UPI0018927B7E|nr:MerR family transcriptional regulator [Quadrisphaera sp. INWT6]MBF5081661.1 MerR family transcriptional regulator [Quadrisphaera sp. INWT6]
MPPPDHAAAGVSLGVAAAARRLGVAPATLRTWARRYGLGPSEHEVGSHRRYSPEDLARLVVMRRLTLEGVPPVSAAASALAADLHESSPVPAPLDADDDGPDPDDEEPAPPAAGGLAAWSAVLPADRTPLTRRPSPAGQDPLQRAVLAGDAPGAAAAVMAACASRGPVGAWEQVVEPARRALARRWEATGAGVDAGVLLTAAAMEALRALRRPPERTTAVVLLAAAEGESDPMPLHVLAAAVAAGGVRPWVLAPGLPREAVAAAVRRTGPAAVLLHAEHGVADAAAQLGPLPRLRHPVRLVLSGPGWAWAHVPEGRPALRAPTLSEALEVLQEATEP